MYKYLIITLIGISSASAQTPMLDILNKINKEFCRSEGHELNLATFTCVYCAEGLQREKSGKCEGTPSVFGKCLVNDHYHAATQECMYCAKGLVFDETLRKCVDEVSKK